MIDAIVTHPWLMSEMARKLGDELLAPRMRNPQSLFAGIRLTASNLLPKDTSCAPCRGSGVGPRYSDCPKCGGSGRFELLGVGTGGGTVTLIIGKALPFTPPPRWPADWPVETPRRIIRIDPPAAPS